MAQVVRGCGAHCVAHPVHGGAWQPRDTGRGDGRIEGCLCRAVHHTWLVETLAGVNRTKTPWVVFTGHRPMYSQEVASADPVMIRAIEPLLLAANVDVALWGHDHVYARSCPIVSNGTCAPAPDDGNLVGASTNTPVHVVCGTAGAFRDDPPGNGTAASWVVAMESCEGCHHWGYCQFVANTTTLTMEYVGFIGIDNATHAPPVVVDRFSLHTPPASPLV